MSTIDWVAGGDATQPPPLSEQQFLLLIESVRDYAIFILDPDGQRDELEPGRRAHQGLPGEEIIGEHFSRFYTPEAVAEGQPEHALATAMRRGPLRRERLARAEGRVAVLGERRDHRAL